MIHKLIRDKTFHTYIRFYWDCTEKEFVDQWNEGHFQIKERNSNGKTVASENLGDISIWINRKNNVETLSHEILHAIRIWLEDYYKIPLNEDTEEIYTMLHSFYMERYLSTVGLKELIA